MNVIKTKIDSKGRISIPYHIRTSLGIDDSSKMKISTSEREIFLTPSAEGVRTRIRLSSFSSLLKIMKIISSYRINISNDRMVSFDKSNIEWSATLEGDSDVVKSTMRKIRKSRSVKHLEYS